MNPELPREPLCRCIYLNTLEGVVEHFNLNIASISGTVHLAAARGHALVRPTRPGGPSNCSGFN